MTVVLPFIVMLSAEAEAQRAVKGKHLCPSRQILRFAQDDTGR
jgi:hypothetical protein